MIKKLYRSVLIALLIIISALLFFTIRNEYGENVLQGNAFSGENIESNPVYSPETGNLGDGVSGSYPSYNMEDGESSVHMVIPSGEPIGIYVKTEGVMVIGVTDIKKSDGTSCSPCKGLFQPGDYIVSVDNETIEDKNHLIEIIETSGGKTLNIELIRDNSTIQVVATPQKSQGTYKLGLWVKDDISGIGTLTFIDENGFAALGHSINDNDTGTVFSISDGAIYDTTLINIVKSDGDTPGRLEGMIDYSKDNIMGRVEKNCEYGISGYMTKNGEEEMADGEWIPVATKEEAHLGEAYLLSGVSGEEEYYKIEITDIDMSSTAGNKGLEIKVTDDRLLSITGGIVQGMFMSYNGYNTRKTQ